MKKRPAKIRDNQLMALYVQRKCWPELKFLSNRRKNLKICLTKSTTTRWNSRRNWPGLFADSALSFSPITCSLSLISGPWIFQKNGFNFPIIREADQEAIGPKWSNVQNGDIFQVEWVRISWRSSWATRVPIEQRVCIFAVKRAGYDKFYFDWKWKGGNSVPFDRWVSIRIVGLWHGFDLRADHQPLQ